MPPTFAKLNLKNFACLDIHKAQFFFLSTTKQSKFQIRLQTKDLSLTLFQRRVNWMIFFVRHLAEMIHVNDCVKLQALFLSLSLWGKPWKRPSKRGMLSLNLFVIPEVPAAL